MTSRRFPNDDLLVSTGWLAGRLVDPGLRIVEVTPPGSGYPLGHIRGAVFLDLAAVFDGSGGGMPHMVGDAGRVAGILGGLGIAPERHVVVYDEIGGPRAAQAFWLLDYLGFPHVSVLEGGVERWLAEGRPQTRMVPPVEAVQFTPGVQDKRHATAEWVASRLGDGNVRIVDCRTRQEFQEGHIPGALNRDWNLTLALRAYQSFRDAGDLASDFASLGVTPDSEIVTYCGTGQRSAHTYLTLRLLGYPRVRNYVGSWAEWGDRPDLPKSFA